MCERERETERDRDTQQSRHFLVGVTKGLTGGSNHITSNQSQSFSRNIKSAGSEKTGKES